MMRIHCDTCDGFVDESGFRFWLQQHDKVSLTLDEMDEDVMTKLRQLRRATRAQVVRKLFEADEFAKRQEALASADEEVDP